MGDDDDDERPYDDHELTFVNGNIPGEEQNASLASHTHPGGQESMGKDRSSAISRAKLGQCRNHDRCVL